VQANPPFGPSLNQLRAQTLSRSPPPRRNADSEDGASHRRKWTHSREPCRSAVYRARPRQFDGCTVEGCDRRHYSQGAVPASPAPPAPLWRPAGRSPGRARQVRGLHGRRLPGAVQGPWVLPDPLRPLAAPGRPPRGREELPARAQDGQCTVEGCDKPHEARGLGSTHYSRPRRRAALKQ
jgi:hypothetical protein